MILAAVPLLEELVKEVRVSLSLGVGLIRRRSWRSGVVLRSLLVGSSRKASMISAIRNSPVIFAAKAHDVGVELATGIQGRGHVSRTRAQRAPGTLLTALVMPMPVPHRATPKSALPLATASYSLTVDGIVRTGVAVGAAVEHL